MNSLTDQELLHDFAKRKFEAAFAELVRRHVDLVYSAALRMVRDRHLAEDVTQGVFVALARGAPQLTDCAVLSAWLYRTAQNLAANAVRTEVRRHSREQEAAVMNELLSPESDTAWEQVAPHLDAALCELNDADRDSLLLRYFERKSAREIGERLGLGEEAAQKRLSRALDKLRIRLANRGVTSTAAALAVTLTGNAVSAAPPAFVATLAGASLATAAVGAGTALTFLKVMTMTNLQTAIVGAIVVAGVATPLVIQRQTQVKLREENQSLRQQVDQFAGLSADHQRLADENARLSNLVSGAMNQAALPPEQLSDLMRLRDEVGRTRSDARATAQLRSSLAEQQGNLQGFMSNAVSSGLETSQKFHERRILAQVRSMKEKLDLSDDQEQAIRSLLLDRSRQRMEQTQLAVTSTLAGEQAAPPTVDLGRDEDAIAALLTPEQQAAFPEFQREEAKALAGKVARSEAARMTKALELSAEEQDRVYETLTRLGQTEAVQPENAPAPVEGLSLAARLSQSVAEEKQRLDRKLQALASVLSTEQLAAYRQDEMLRIEGLESAMKLLVPRASPPASR